MIEEIEKDSHALKPFFDVILCDENDQPLSWTKGLVQSISYPTFSFVVNDQNAGTSRGYEGWTLPESLSITMYETKNRDLEKYLLEWAFGEKGIFDITTGNFRTAEKESYLYKQVIFRTTAYETSLSGYLNHSSIDISNIVAFTLKTVLDTFSGGKLSIAQEDFITEISKEFANNVLQENAKEPENINLTEKQQIPILDKLTKLGETIANQALTRIPYGRAISVPVIIPPTLMEVPIDLNLNVKSIVSKILNPSKPNLKIGKGFSSTSKATNSLSFNRLPSFSELKVMDSSKAALALREGAKKIDNILSRLPKASSKEVTTSTSTYRVALRSFTVDNYSYDTGGPVSFTLDLPLADYIVPQLT